MGKTRKKKAIEKLAGREKVSVSIFPRFIFVFALSQFSGPEYLGAWNRQERKVRSAENSLSLSVQTPTTQATLKSVINITIIQMNTSVELLGANDLPDRIIRLRRELRSSISGSIDVVLSCSIASA